MSNQSKTILLLRVFGVFLFMLNSFGAFSQNDEQWFEEYEKMESHYKYGKYHQARDQAKSILKKTTKKDELTHYKLPTEALLIKYQGALGLRLEFDSILSQVLHSWDSIPNYESDSMAIMGNYTMALTCVAFNRYHSALTYLNTIDNYLTTTNDPNSYWQQQVLLTRIEVNQKTMNFKFAIDNIDSVIAYQANQVYLISNFDTLKKRNDLFKSKKKAYTREASKLGVLVVQKGDIYLDKGDVHTANEIYLKNDSLLKNLVPKRDISVLYNAYGKAQANYLLGIPSSSKDLSHIRKKYADYVKYSIPNLTYFEMFEKEIQSEIRFDNFNKYSKGVQQYQRESLKNYTTKSTHSFHSKYLANISYLNNKKYQAYEKQMSKQKAIIHQYYSPMDPDQISFLYDLALSQIYVSDYSAALNTYQNIVDIIKFNNSDTSGLFYQANLELGAFYLEHTTDYEKADSLYQKYYEPFVVEELSPYHPSYPRFLQVFAQIEAKKDFFEKAIQKQLLSTRVQLDKTGVDSYEYAVSLQLLSSIQIQMGLLSDAEKNLKTSVQIFEAFKNINPEPYINSLQDYSEILAYNGYYNKAISRLQTAMELSSSLTLNKTVTVTSIQDHLAEVYLKQENYSQAEEILIQNLKSKSTSVETNDETLIQTHCLLAQVYLQSNQTYKARKHIRSAMRISSRLLGTNSLIYLQSKKLLADWYVNLNEHSRAKTIYNGIQISYENKFGKDYLGIAELLVSKTKIDIHLGNYNDSLQTQLTRATNIISKNVHEQHPSIAEIIDLKAQVFLINGEQKQALIQYQTANLLYHSLFGSSNYRTAENLVKMGMIYSRMKDYNNALSNISKGASIYESLYGQNHPKYAFALNELAKVQYANQNISEAISSLRQSLLIFNHYLINEFFKIPEAERYKTWERIKEAYNLFNIIALNYYKTDPSVISDMYNNQIVTKSILLRTSAQVKKRVIETNNAQLKSDYKHWTNQQNTLVGLIASPTDSNSMDRITELKSYVDYLEYNVLSQTDSLIGQNTIKPVKWTTIKSQLKQTSAAVEMIRIADYSQPTDNVIYAALVINKDSKNNPNLVILNNGNELEGKYYINYRNSLQNNTVDRSSYNQYWKQIDAQCLNKTDIYFSGVGVYNQINPETFKPIGIPHLLGKYSFHYVSTTANLIPNKKANTWASYTNDISLIGDPNFGKPTNVLPPIPGTKKEINQVESLFSSNNWATTKYAKEKASEILVKKISNPRVLHFATYGFFMDNTTFLDQRFIYYPHLTPLLKTGLYLTNANAIVADSNTVSYCYKNGALTALEISSFDLNKTELVFLSATDIDQKAINNGIGTNTLQHAFEIGGAKNIIMTTHKIDNKITREFVNLFYSEWIRIGSIEIALVSTKKKISSKYNNPLYWGAFILLELQ